MNCLECQALLQRRLDGEALVESSAQAHLEACPDCRAQWESAEMLLRGLASFPVIQPPPNLVGRVLAVAQRERVVRRRLTWQRVAVAAALLLTPWLGVQMFWRDAHRIGPTQTKMAAVEPLGDILYDLQSAVAGVGEGLYDVSRDQLQAVQTAAGPLEDTPLAAPPRVEPSAPRVTGLTIVGNRTQRAFDFFTRASE